MAGVGEGEETIREYIGAQASGKAAETKIGQDKVEVAQKFSRRVFFPALGCAQQHSRGHGGRSSLSAHIAQQNALMPGSQNAATVKVASDLARGGKRNVDFEAWEAIDRQRHRTAPAVWVRDVDGPGRKIRAAPARRSRA